MDTGTKRSLLEHDTVNADFNKIPTHSGQVDLKLRESYGVVQQKLMWEGYKMYPWKVILYLYIPAEKFYQECVRACMKRRFILVTISSYN